MSSAVIAAPQGGLRRIVGRLRAGLRKKKEKNKG